MNALLAAILAAVVAVTAAPAFSADAHKSQEKAGKSRPTPRSDPPDELFSKAQKALQERAAKTAEVIKKNVANIKKRVSGEPEPPAKKVEPKSAPKDKKEKKDRGKKAP